MRFRAHARDEHVACFLLPFRFGSAASLLLAASFCLPTSAALAAGELPSAVRDAWQRHPAADATERTLAAASARANAAARPVYNPELELDVLDEGEERTATAGLGWTLDVSGKRRARSALGRSQYGLAEAEAAQRRASFALQWLRAWADRLAASERARVGAQRLQLVERFAELAQRQRDVGDISTLERDLAFLARDEAQAEQAMLESDAASADEALRVVGGGDLTVEPPPDPPMPATEAGSLGVAPETRVAEASAAETRSRIDVARRDRRPDPTLRLTAGRKDIGPLTDDVIGLTFSVPLFVRNDFRAEVVAAESDADASEAELRRIELEGAARAERAVRTHAAVRKAWTRWSASPGTDVARRAELLEKLWRAGELSTADYLIQLKQSLDTALAGAELRGRLWRSYFDLLYATGRLDAWVGFATNEEVTP